MTPLKFRAYSKSQKRMMSVDAIAFSYSTFSGQKGQEVLVSEGKPYQKDIEKLPSKGVWHIADPDPNGIHPSDVILMQSTGLTDKNGLPIFEGDVVRREGKLYPVVFINAAFRTGHVIHADILASSDEVIGNIYQNPDLLS